MLTAKTLLNFDNPIFHKIVKKLGFGLGTAYRFGFCQKFEKKTLDRPKLGPQNTLYDISGPFLRLSFELKFAIFG